MLNCDSENVGKPKNVTDSNSAGLKFGSCCFIGHGFCHSSAFVIGKSSMHGPFSVTNYQSIKISQRLPKARLWHLPGKIIVTSLWPHWNYGLGNSPNIALFQVREMAVCQNLVPLVNIKIAGKWMFIPLKMVLIGIDPYPNPIIYPYPCHVSPSSPYCDPHLRPGDQYLTVGAGGKQDVLPGPRCQWHELQLVYDAYDVSCILYIHIINIIGIYWYYCDYIDIFFIVVFGHQRNHGQSNN